MRKLLFVLLLAAAALASGGCWLWEDQPVSQTPLPTPSPPKVEEAGQSSPAITGRLLYSADGHIWMRTGTTSRRLTESTPGTQPCWSPDGRQIAFVVKGEAYSDIWVMAADGSDLHPLTQDRSSEQPFSHEFAHSSYWAFQPQWIPPSGEWISFISHPLPQYASGQMSVWIIRPDGTEKQQYLPLNGVESPSWSPDGGSLAFTFFTYENGAQLRYLDLESNTIRPLGTDVEGIQRYDAAWSPDGAWIAYTARQADSTDLWIMPSPQNPLYSGEWSPVRQTSRGMNRAPAWSPDGQQLAFIAKENDSFDLWLLKLKFVPEQLPQPAGEEKLTDGADVDATARPSWAP